MRFSSHCSFGGIFELGFIPSSFFLRKKSLCEKEIKIVNVKSAQKRSILCVIEKIRP